MIERAVRHIVTDMFQRETLIFPHIRSCSELRERLGTHVNPFRYYKNWSKSVGFDSTGLSIDRQLFDRWAQHIAPKMVSDLSPRPDTPHELYQLLLLERLGAVPANSFHGIKDVISLLPKLPLPTYSELREKRERVSSWLSKMTADYLLLDDLNVQAWLLGGLDFHEITNTSVARLLVPRDVSEPIHILINNIEKPRIFTEELEKNLGMNWANYADLVVNSWYKPQNYSDIVGDRKVISGKDYPGFHSIHYSFLPQDITRYEWLAQAATAALVKEAFFINFGSDTEAEIAARISRMLLPFEIFPEVLLVAADDKIRLTNHPIPRADNVAKTLVMMVLCARYKGYVVNLTRFVHKGEPSERMLETLGKCSLIYASAHQNTVPGSYVGEVTIEGIFRSMMEHYQALGHGGEWQKVHQGGPTGIGIRDFLATPYCNQPVLPNQPFTWNPIISGLKVEDTTITAASGNKPPRTLTVDPYGWWPMVDIPASDSDLPPVRVPNILVRH